MTGLDCETCNCVMEDEQIVAIHLAAGHQIVPNYQSFIAEKLGDSQAYGFTARNLPTFLFPFQAQLVEWNLYKGQSATFADCGLGKTPMQLVWADQVLRHENRPVLLLDPLAVSAQSIQEANKFDIEAYRSKDGKARAITVTNYESLHRFNPHDFCGVACDESSILKSFDGVRRQEITEFMRRVKYRSLWTATAAPNDYIELGTSSEALGYLGHVDMLNRFFKNDKNNSAQGRMYGKQLEWRFKGHAEQPFWKWVCSWARAVRKPSDLGFPDEQFVLPPLIEREHLIEAKTLPEGKLFAMPAVGLWEQREERRRTITERCEKVAELVNHKAPALVWCDLNPEGDLLEKLIPDAVQVSGQDSDDAKEEKFLSFVNRKSRVLITKKKIGAWGLNFQHCAHETYFPSHSFEQYYQGVRRCWRFGQTKPVTVDIVTTEGERGVLDNLQRKQRAADRMFANLVERMNEQLHIDRGVSFPHVEEIPTWLS